MTELDVTDDAIVGLLERSLARQAATASCPGSFAARARLRHRVRSRRRAGMAAGASLAVVAVVAIPVALLDGPRDPGTTGAGPSGVVEQLPVQRAAPDGWRWEAYGQVQLLVPAAWGYGASGAGCWSAEQPHVGRPPSTEGERACLMRSAIERRIPFLWLDGQVPTPPSDEGDGWVVETTSAGGEHIAVFSDDAQLRADILASVEVIPTGGTDAYGCPVTHPLASEPAWRPTPLDGATDPDSVSGAVICEYSPPAWGDGGLHVGQFLRSGRLPAFTAQAIAEAAPTGQPVTTSGCEPSKPFGNAALLLRFEHAGGVFDTVVRYQGCFLHGTDDGATTRALTSALAVALDGSAVALAVEAGARVSHVIEADATLP